MRLQCKRPVTVGNKSIGGSVPFVCLPLVAKNTKVLLQQAKGMMPLEPDLLEWRIDGFDKVHNIKECLQALSELRTVIGTTPLIFTCRISKEGGMQEISRDLRLTLITEAIANGEVDLVDTELCNDPEYIQTILYSCQKNGKKLILSFHDFEKTPTVQYILKKLQQAQQMGAHIAKAAVMPNNYADVLILLEATLKARNEVLQIPIISMSMGVEGVVTRIAGGLFGSDITFATGTTSSAPGQIPIGELRQAMSVVYCG